MTSTITDTICGCVCVAVNTSLWTMLMFYKTDSASLAFCWFIYIYFWDYLYHPHDIHDASSVNCAVGSSDTCLRYPLVNGRVYGGRATSTLYTWRMEMQQRAPRAARLFIARQPLFDARTCDIIYFVFESRSGGCMIKLHHRSPFAHGNCARWWWLVGLTAASADKICPMNSYK